MAYNPLMAERMREALLSFGDVQEKHMFGSLGFMVNGRLVICVQNNDVMYKLGKDRSHELIEREVAVAVEMGNRTMKGWADVPIERLSNSTLFNELLAEAVKEEL